jgi:hypothetical protein
VSEDERRQDLSEALSWAWTVVVQRRRVAAHEAVAQAGVVARDTRLATGTQVPYTHESAKPFIELRADRHFLLVAARNLLRAMKRLQRHGVDADIPEELAADIVVLRNCFEHWDERDQTASGKGRAGSAFRQFAENHPGDDPTSFRFGAGGTLAGGLDLDELAAVAADLHDRLVELDRSDFVWRGWRRA